MGQASKLFNGNTDQTLIGASFADVTLTGLPVAASSTYAFEFYILIDSDNTTTGIDVAVNGPTIGAGSIYYEQVYWTSATVFASARSTRMTEIGACPSVVPG